MKQGGIISVNPGRKTLGELNRLGDLQRITRTIASAPGIKSSLKAFLKLATGLSYGEPRLVSSRLLLTRLLFGAAFLTWGGMALHESDSSLLTISALVIGISLVTGLFCRILTAAGAAYLVWIMAASGVADTTRIAAALILSSSAILGPGRYSLDNVLRHFTLKSARRSIRRKANRRFRRDAMSYQAYMRL